MEIGKLEEKAIRVIESCTSASQIDAATRYVELYFKKTGNLPYLRYLITKLDELANSFS